MLRALLFSLSLFLTALLPFCFAGANSFYPARIDDISHTHSGQRLSALWFLDQFGKDDTWKKYIEFDGTNGYAGIFTFNVGNINPAAASLTVNFKGQEYTSQGWMFEIGMPDNQWVKIGDTKADTRGWDSWMVMSWNVPAFTISSMIQDSQIRIKFSSMRPLDSALLDYVKLTLTTASVPPTSTTWTGSYCPTTPPTVAPTTGPVPTFGPSSKRFNLRYLILSASNADTNGLDWAKIAFDSVGTPYDLVVVTAATSLADYLSTSGIGKYAGVVTIKKNVLSAEQQQLVSAYQQFFGVKWAVVGSDPSGLPGLSAQASTTSDGPITLPTEFLPFSTPLKADISINAQYILPGDWAEKPKVIPATITDPTLATPALLFSSKVAAAVVKQSDNTQQLHFFIDMSKHYFFCRVFHVLLINWLSPGGIFVGRRELPFLVQPDDLFMASNRWDMDLHVNSEIKTYRMTAGDLQAAADWVNNINPTLPYDSHVTIEWPYNGAGTLWYENPDTLFAKAKEPAVRDTFIYVSHTYNHPCDFNTASYESIYSELSQNIDFTPSFLPDGMKNKYLSNDSLVNPCITGLFNGNCLKAMKDNGIIYAVGDNSIPDLVPPYLWHPITTNSVKHGFDGILIIPRVVLEIGYDCTDDKETVDQYKTYNNLDWTFEQILAKQVDYALARYSVFLHDPYMWHQANVRFFSYDDPVAGKTHSVSLVTLWMERVIHAVLKWWDLPFYTPTFHEMAQLWIQRQTNDECGFNFELAVEEGRVVGVTASAPKTCNVPLSGVQLGGGNVENVQTGVERTSFISLTPGQTYTYAVPNAPYI